MGTEKVLPVKVGVWASWAGSGGSRPQRPRTWSKARGAMKIKARIPQSLRLPFSLKMEKLGIGEVDQGHPAGWSLGWAQAPSG